MAQASKDEERVDCILPLRLTGDALTVHRQLKKEQRADIEEIKCTLTTAFATFEQFATQRLCNRETVDELLAALERLAC